MQFTSVMVSAKVHIERNDGVLQLSSVLQASSVLQLSTAESSLPITDLLVLLQAVVTQIMVAGYGTYTDISVYVLVAEWFGYGSVGVTPQ